MIIDRYTLMYHPRSVDEQDYASEHEPYDLDLWTHSEDDYRKEIVQRALMQQRMADNAKKVQEQKNEVPRAN